MTQNADSLTNTIPVISTSGLGEVLQQAFSPILNTPNVLAAILIQEHGGEPAFRAYIRGSNSQKEEWVFKVEKATVSGTAFFFIWVGLDQARGTQTGFACRVSL